MFICDAIQQKVHKVGKLVFPNATEIGREDSKEHFTKIKSIDACEVELLRFRCVIAKFLVSRK